MPRKYTRKEGAKRYQGYDPEKLKEAINAVKIDGCSFKSAAKKHDVNVMTLKRACRRANSELPSFTNRKVFTAAQETELAEYLTNMAQMYYGLTVVQFRKLTYEYAKVNNINLPTEIVRVGWMIP